MDNNLPDNSNDKEQNASNNESRDNQLNNQDSTPLNNPFNNQDSTPLNNPFNNPDSTPHNHPHNGPEKKPNAGIDALIGIGITVLTYCLVFLPLTFFEHLNPGWYTLLCIITVSAAVVTSVMLIRRNHTVAGIIAIVFVSPVILFSLAVGSCSLLFKGF